MSADVTFRPYVLDPLVPREGRPYKDYMRAKFGDGAEGFRQMREVLEASAPKAGIAFRFDEMEVRPNTLDAHRLMRWAQGQDLGAECAEALFAAYFKDLRDIGDAEVLSDIANEIGMDGDLVRELLATDRDTDKVEEEVNFFRRLGVSGVPTFIYGGEMAIQGAQEPDAHRTVAREIRKMGGKR